ncbi:MAG: ECF transporter S component [Alistipes sp.]|nr:ECF transporter S component [Alistipes sp.]
MQTFTAKLHSLEYRQARTYLVALLFVLGNIALPQLCHTLRMGGPTWLPIYFFTLVAAYKYGWRAGLLTAVASPLANALLFGMPAPVLLPAILLKSAILAVAAGWTAARFRRVSLLLLAGVVLAYQTLGSLGEWALVGDLRTAMQDFRIGLPGMLLQVFGGRVLIGLPNLNRHAR